MNTITVTLPTIEQVDFDLICENEYTPIKGNALVSGNDDEDREAEAEIFRQIAEGNGWAWCAVEVKAKWRGIEGSDYLGCCSYKSEDDFKKDGYYTDMKREAYAEIIRRIKSLSI